MARSRTPTIKAQVSGAALKNPDRFKDRAAPGTRSLGKPYPKMTRAQKKAWREFAAELPWLNGSHRQILRLACVLSAKMEEGEIGVQATQALGSILSKLGATPADQSKVNYDPDSEDPAAEFFNEKKKVH